MSAEPEEIMSPTEPLARRIRIRDWELWTLPRPAVALALGVQFGGAVLLWAAARGLEQPSRRQAIFLVVAGAGIVVPRIRAAGRWADSLNSYQGMEHVQHVADDCWLVAVALVLPWSQGVLLVVFCELLTAVSHRVAYSRSPMRWLPPRRPSRIAFNISIHMLAVALARCAFTAAGGAGHFDGRALVGAALAGVTIQVVLTVLLFSILHLSSQVPWRSLVRGEAKTSVAEISQKCLGVLIWVAWERAGWSILFAFPLLLSFERAQRHAALLQEARTHGKTGLLNASYWSGIAEAAFARADGSGSSVTVAIIDLDHFKRVNDTHGHGVGDQVLRQVAARISASARPGDVVGRFGGEEFTLLLTRTDLAQASHVAERIRAVVAAAPLECGVVPGSLPIQVTCSIGVASSTGRPDATLQEALERADRALYRAKAAGRNRVELDGNDSLEAAVRPTWSASAPDLGRHADDRAGAAGSS